MPVVPTPFNRDASVNFTAYGQNIARLIDSGVHGIISLATAGEGASMSAVESVAVVTAALEAANGRVPVLAGVGGPNEIATVELMRHLEHLGVTQTPSTHPGLVVDVEDDGQHVALAVVVGDLLGGRLGWAAAEISRGSGEHLGRDAVLGLPGIALGMGVDVDRHDPVEIDGHDGAGAPSSSAGSRMPHLCGAASEAMALGRPPIANVFILDLQSLHHRRHALPCEYQASEVCRTGHNLHRRNQTALH